MKKFLKNVKDMIFRHKLLSLICLLAFVIILVMLYIFFSVFIGSNGKYGDRLDGIEKVEVSKDDLNEVADFLKEKDEVTDANARVQGRIVYIHIEVTRETSLDRAKEIANEILSKFDEEELAFYDFGYSLTQVAVEGNEDKGFVITGSKNASLDSISWIKS